MGQRVQRVAAYAVIIRDGQILLSRLAPHVSREGLWTLPGGGLDHGEDPRDAVVREVHEETGLTLQIGETAHTFSLHLPDTWRKGRRVDAHSLRIVYEGWVPPDSPPPRVLEVDGSTVEAAWHPVAGVHDGSVPTVALVKEALAVLPAASDAAGRGVRVGGARRGGAADPELAAWPPPRLVEPPRRRHRARRGARRRRGARGARRRPGWRAPLATSSPSTTRPCAARRRRAATRSCHSVGIVYDATVPPDAEPRVVEVDGTTDRAAWVPLADVESGATPVYDTVRAALAARLPQ